MPDTREELGRLAEGRRSAEQGLQLALLALREGCLRAYRGGAWKSEISRAAGVSRTSLDAWIKEEER